MQFYRLEEEIYVQLNEALLSLLNMKAIKSKT